MALGVRFVRGLAQQRGALLVEFRVFVLELVAFLFGFGSLRIGVGEFRGDFFFARVNGVEDGLVKKMLHQPHQDEEIQHLRANGEPVN